jgi:hypothetical protein
MFTSNKRINQFQTFEFKSNNNANILCIPLSLYFVKKVRKKSMTPMTSFNTMSAIIYDICHVGGGGI